MREMGLGWGRGRGSRRKDSYATCKKQRPGNLSKSALWYS